METPAAAVPPVAPVTTSPPAVAAPGFFQKYPIMKPLLWGAVGLLAGYFICNYRNKKYEKAKSDAVAKDIALAFNEMLDKAVAANQTLPAFRDEWAKNLTAANNDAPPAEQPQ